MTPDIKLRLKGGVSADDFNMACWTFKRATKGKSITAQVLVGLGMDRQMFGWKGNRRMRLKRTQQKLEQALRETMLDMVEVVP